MWYSLSNCLLEANYCYSFVITLRVLGASMLTLSVVKIEILYDCRCAVSHGLFQVIYKSDEHCI